MMIENEEFIPYAKNENYLISRNGNVYSLLTNKILKHRIDSGGYHMVSMMMNGKQKNVFIKLF